MNIDKLHQFLLVNNAAGYAQNNSKKWIKESDSSTTIPFKKGDWIAHDNFFGGEPYGGRLVVFYKKKPVWLMVYYGWVEKGVDSSLVYPVLQKALMNMPKDAPFRGPKTFLENGYCYANSWQGNIKRYYGEEKIAQGLNIVYQAFYRGGLVDQQ